MTTTSPFLSLILPTRGRVDQLDRFMKSLLLATRNLDAIEVVLIVDADDEESLRYVVDERVRCARVVVAPGLKMGALNTAGYGASTGANIMLVNDDVVITTLNWDEHVSDVIRAHPDGIYLIHVNDGIFEDKLCTFPLVSRAFCELQGSVCPEDYRRYRIDDHIYNVFNLLSVIGTTRIFYLSNVNFEHQNFVHASGGKIEYQPDPLIHAEDTRLFDELLPARKELALKLAERVDLNRSRLRRERRRELLEPVHDSVSLRRPEFVHRLGENQLPTSKTDRVTIGVVTADVRSEHAQACIQSLKRFTHNFELVVLDNGRAPGFNHAREMNRLIEACRTDYLILLDDDVIVEAGWLDGMFTALNSKTGVVTPSHRTVDGSLSYAGVTMRPEATGYHGHALKTDEDRMCIQTLCSAAMLVDMNKCGDIRFDERCSKYFQDIDYGLQVWESDFEVALAANVIVTHIAGATLKHGSDASNALFEEHRRIFLNKWVHTGRYDRIATHQWRSVPDIVSILQFPRRLDALLHFRGPKDVGAFLEQAHSLFEDLEPYPDLKRWALDRILKVACNKRPGIDDPDGWHLACLMAFADHPTWLECHPKGFNIVLTGGYYHGIPAELGPVDPRNPGTAANAIIRARRLAVLRGLIESTAATPREIVHRAPEVLCPDYRGFEIVRHDKVYAVPVNSGSFTLERLERGEYPVWFAAYDEKSVRRQVYDIAPVLVETARNGFAIIRYGNYYAIPDSQQPFNYGKFKAGKYARSFMASNIDDVRRFVDNAELIPAVTTPKPSTRVEKRDSKRWLETSPVRSHGTLGSFAVYSFEFKYFAIPAAEGPFEYERFRAGQYATSFVAHSIPELRTKIRVQEPRSVLVLAKHWSPRLDKLVREYVSRVGAARVAINCPDLPRGFKAHRLPAFNRGGDALQLFSRGWGAAEIEELQTRSYDRIVVSWDGEKAFANTYAEDAAARISSSVEILFPTGTRRTYIGEDAHRLIYNKAYISSMLSSLDTPKGLRLLEVGCSDGLVCDIMLRLGARKVTGVDVMQTTGCNYPDERIDYRVMDATHLRFAEHSFDWAYSIATFEHLPKPQKTLDELLRVLKIGGYGYVQAGPLYYSPFGHHMFAYFDDEPWIHLRKTETQITEYAIKRGIDRKIAEDLDIDVAAYVAGMLSNDHINGLNLTQYKLDAFCARSDVRVIKQLVSKEGEDLLTDKLRSEIRGVDSKHLTEHGFELLFQRIA